MHWLTNNLSREPEVKCSGGRVCEGEQTGELAQATGPSEAEDMKDMESFLSTFLPDDDDVHDTAAVKIRQSVDLDSSMEEQDDEDLFLKKVSFAKHSLRYPIGTAQSPEKVTESDRSSVYLEGGKTKDTKDGQKLWLQTRPFSSPPPPRGVSPTPIIKSRLTPTPPECTGYSLDPIDSWAINGDDNYNSNLDSPSSLSPAVSNISIITGSEIIRAISNTDLKPDTHSKQDSLAVSIASDYYSPFDSLYDWECNKDSNISIPRSSSAPSFMICATGKDQQSHYLADDSTIEDFKAYLLNISDLDIPENVKPIIKDKYSEDDEQSDAVDSESSSFKSVALMLGSSQNKKITSNHTYSSSSDCDAYMKSPPKESQTKKVIPPICRYRDIALSELLDRIYPVNATSKSSEDSMSPSPQHDSHFRFAGLMIRSNHNVDMPAISNLQKRSCSMATCSTEKSDHTVTSTLSDGYVKVSLGEPIFKPVESIDASCGSTSNMPSTLMLHESEDDEDSSVVSIGQTYSIHGSDSSSAFTIPSLPLDRIPTSPPTVSASSISSTPVSGACCDSAMDNTSTKESADTSSEIPSTVGSTDDNNLDGFYPKQGSSSEYYSECLSQPTASLINDSADISMMTIPTLSLGLVSRASGDSNNKSTATDSSSEVPSSPAKTYWSDGGIYSTEVSHLQTRSEPEIRFETTFNDEKVSTNSFSGERSGIISALQNTSQKNASPVSTSEKSIVITIPKDMLNESGQEEGTKSEPAFGTFHADRKVKNSSNVLAVPPLLYTSDTSPYLAVKDPKSVTELTSSNMKLVRSDISSNDTSSAKEGSDDKIPSLSLKITAWSSEGDTDTKLPKVASTPAKMSSDKYRAAKKNNSVAITVMEPPRIICDQSSISGSSDGKQSSKSFNASLKYVTELLESSHNSLAKAVQSLSKKAVIKQSNISLELVLPLKDYQKLERDAQDIPVKMESHLAKLQLNSSTFYTTEDSQSGDQDNISTENTQALLYN